MIPKNSGGSAFPNDGRWANDCAEGGMTLRDYFAAAALQGLLSNDTALHAFDRLAEKHGQCTSGIAASEAMRYADAMLEARKK